MVQVDTLAVGLLTGEGLNVYSISPSLLIATALGAGWTGTCLASFAGQASETFETIRHAVLSRVCTAGRRTLQLEYLSREVFGASDGVGSNSDIIVALLLTGVGAKLQF